jgi:sortase A
LIKIKLNYLIVILGVLVLLGAVTAVAFSNNIKPVHFLKDEISFDYPDTWQTVNQTRTSEIVGFTDPEADLNVTVNRQPLPAGYMPTDNFTLNSTEAESSGFKFVSEKTLDINGTAAYENIYEVTVDNRTVHRTEIWMNKNDALYSIIYTSGDKVKDENSPEVQVLTKSLVINNTDVSNTIFFGEISIPALGVNWKMNNETVNQLGSVYHYSESYYPGHNGTIGLLGHHTRYSAPFANINLLKAGDTVTVSDYLTQKKYVYEVTSNGDIKGDYKTNPIQFPGGVFELTLVTCYPPGFQEAAYMTHCKLKSVQPL